MEHTLQALTPGTSHAWYRALYTEHRGAFVQWAARQYGVREEEARDAFQEAVIVLYRKAQGDDLASLNCSLRTYLFAVGRNQLLSRMRVLRKQEDLHEEFHGIPDEALATNGMERQEKEATAELVRQRLAELKPDDRRVLELYYLEGKDMDAVAEALGLKNRNVAKKKKHFALQRLIALVRSAKMLLL
ncbi:MAG TPA: sigma-70 family RNA polymerase sigma factor [Flavobacteriales bacterium]|nr:sigma-70 family RNA polymerase sigma factor [Flavobacteriales bacterium]HMW96661.1 sigma-70 family RNA polymerase sigma factor [Flavobacteriales bacterium]HNE80517.1 sigma-70 family RNA polymerase sigma factor [Flavobacteriales bacterium]HNI05176.1 sigma-70 family RNA polymerase sigma factor [Flavobacteriales bacterium]HNK42096.1 sigma-70 family RNA polymerase sigma factor [Flavobacteriales bacterium]